MSLDHSFKPLFAAGLCAAAFGVQAHVAETVTLDFQTIPSAVYGEANTALVGPGQCAGSFTGANCYFEDDFIIGVVSDPVGEGEHLHRTGATTNRRLSYHADSSGIYVRAEDGHEFGLFSLDFDARLSDDSNPDSGPGEVWEILGFNTAVNPDLSSGDGTNYATRVAYQTVDNGFNGVLTLNHDFHDINAFWIHYKGFPGVPDGSKDFAVVIDNIVLGPAEPAPVPVPAVGLWMLASGVAGIAALGRRRTQAA
jgi:hypothetical protein